MSAPATVNPFIITRDAAALGSFLMEVFDASENAHARTVDTDGLLLHSEYVVGTSTIAVAERKPDWPFTPSLLQVWVADAAAALARAEARGAAVVTRPTEFFGSVLARFTDEWGNLWWLYEEAEQTDSAPGGDDDWGEAEWDADSTETWEATAELTYINDTLIEAMRHLGARE
ncbi:glyoxalase/bleomycin resistance/extradiol dioxygenase family protein [Microbacterium sp. G2-8]|uniref:VOC family protein n=1 Tax=Microbacterium sp. G2-8 TaxID=2842454 RepID=UPI001C894CAF|nr:VOC family protein [Microbacterium sp. G2-8]